MLKMLKPEKMPSELMAFTNSVYCNSSEFSAKTKYVLVNSDYCFYLQRCNDILSGSLGTSLYQRNWASMFEGEPVQVSAYELGSDEVLSALEIRINFAMKSLRMDKPCEIEFDNFSQYFHREFNETMFTCGQTIPFLFNSIKFILSVVNVENANMQELSLAQSVVESYQKRADKKRGILISHTVIRVNSDSPNAIRITGNFSAQPSVLLQPDFKFEDMGIGGLDDEFKTLFRRAFVSRIIPPNLVDKMGISHVRGVILYGPPGTGKTLMARQIGRMLGSHEPKKVSGPEVLNKYVGQSEENVRNLFADAEMEYRERGDASQLHIIIFDEIDAICKQRGSKSDSTGVGDTVVNQLLAKMDGVDQLNNILVIGMTNRLDMIDEALLRPGRFEVHVEIKLPDESGRLQILKIHTEKMRESHILDSSVDLHGLATKTKNFSGAEIAGLVKSAASFAFNRHVNVGTMASVSKNIVDLKVHMEDFERALSEVHAAFGRSDGDFEDCALYGLIPFSPILNDSLYLGSLMIKQLKSIQSNSRVLSLLLYGDAGTGKTSIACEIARMSDFPFFKIISPETLVGHSEMGKASAINKIFDDAHKSPLSVIVVDCIEKIMEFVPLGPRFSNLIYQSLSVLIKKVPQKGRRLFVIVTSSNRNLLEDMDLCNIFDKEICIPPILNAQELTIVLDSLQIFSKHQIMQIENILRERNINLKIGVKKLINLVEMSGQEPEEDRVSVFIDLLMSALMR